MAFTNLTRRAGALTALGAMAALLLVLPTPRGAEGQETPPYTVTVTPTQNLTDGRQIAINIKTTTAYPVYEAQARVCRPGVTYEPGDGIQIHPGGRKGGPNCPDIPVSSSASVEGVSAKTFQFAPTPEGETIFMRVGTGVVAWEDATTGNFEQRTLTCDVNNPCWLVVQLYTAPSGQPPNWIPVIVPLTYAEIDPLSGCGGVAEGSLTASGSDAVSDAWIRWTLDSCGKKGPAGAWTTMSFGSDAEALVRAAEGKVDLAYTTNGESAGFLEKVENPRTLIPVPVALGASVLGVANGYIDPFGRKRPYGPIQITVGEFTSIVAKGEYLKEVATPIQNRNPELGRPPGMFLAVGTNKMNAFSEAGGVPWQTTRFLNAADTTEPNQTWRSPDGVPELGADQNKPRGVHQSFGLASPTFAFVLGLLTGRPGLARELGRLPADGGGFWLLGDWSTTEAYDMRAVSVETTPGTFVAPSTESLQAAVPGLEKLPDGTRAPTPSNRAGYPLTYVLYAFAPANPLADANNVCRPGSQELLKTWLTYLVGDGQKVLPPGFAPLTDELRAEADERIAQVGATPAATPCTTPDGGEPPPPGPDAQPTGAGGAPTGTGDGGPVGAGGGPSRAGTGPGSTSGTGSSVSVGDAAAAAAAAEEALLASSTDIPGFVAGLLPSWLLAIGGIVAVVLLAWFAARTTSAGIPPPGAGSSVTGEVSSS